MILQIAFFLAPVSFDLFLGIISSLNLRWVQIVLDATIRADIALCDFDKEIDHLVINRIMAMLSISFTNLRFSLSVQTCMS